MIYDTVLTIGLSTTAANFCWMIISLRGILLVLSLLHIGA